MPEAFTVLCTSDASLDWDMCNQGVLNAKSL